MSRFITIVLFVIFFGGTWSRGKVKKSEKIKYIFDVQFIFKAGKRK